LECQAARVAKITDKLSNSRSEVSLSGQEHSTASSLDLLLSILAEVSGLYYDRNAGQRALAQNLEITLQKKTTTGQR
jgi:hypothetical protein